MAYQTGSATSQEDLITQLFTFATANGWTQDELNTGTNRGSLHNTGGGVFVHFAWDGSDADNIAMAQSLAFGGTGLEIDGHTNDSGNGASGASLASERRVSRIGNGTMTSYDFFIGPGSPDYVYVVLEFSPGLYRHFGFGELNKIGDWTGGEWCAGHVWDEDGVQDDNPTAGTHTILMDGLHTSTVGTEELDAATIHIEGLPGQFGAPGRWGQVGNGNNATWRGSDGDAQLRTQVNGGIRGGFWLKHFGWLNANLLNGFVPLIPIPIVYEATVNTEYMLLGFLPDVRHIQMANFTPGQTVTVGSDTWHIFPGVRKQFLQANTQETRNMGIAYKQTA